MASLHMSLLCNAALLLRHCPAHRLAGLWIDLADFYLRDLAVGHIVQHFGAHRLGLTNCNEGLLLGGSDQYFCLNQPSKFILLDARVSFPV